MIIIEQIKEFPTNDTEEIKEILSEKNQKMMKSI